MTRITNPHWKEVITVQKWFLLTNQLPFGIYKMEIGSAWWAGKDQMCITGESGRNLTDTMQQ